ncbi:MAG: cell envelope biogenesis protein OmpA, partial [Gammaproteobacteria bacterium]|nr:cell envelope biogenesis protein OmpA [Gammaproteobacteria bacterium]
MGTRTAALGLVVTALLSACATVQDTATSPDYHKTRAGAGIGAGVGAVVGLLTRGDKFQNALIGAAIGGLAGGAVGNYQDRQERALRA